MKKFQILHKKTSVFGIVKLKFLTDQKDPSSWNVTTCAEHGLKIILTAILLFQAHTVHLPLAQKVSKNVKKKSIF